MDKLGILRKTVISFVENCSEEQCLELLASLTGCPVVTSSKQEWTPERTAKMLASRAANKKAKELEQCYAEVGSK
jgi:hypothetical protein